MNLLRLLALILLLTSVDAVEQKTEVKFLITDFNRIPSDILDALKIGEEHEEILRRGFVVQDYLAVTRKNLFEIRQKILAAGIPFGEFDPFALPGKTQEIRFMRKCIKENGAIRDIYQIALQGPGGLANAKLETPVVLTEEQLVSIREIFTYFLPEVNDRVYKCYFELIAKGLYSDDGLARTVEVDIFLKNDAGTVTPLFIAGEIKFKDKDPFDHAQQFRKNPALYPDYFSQDVTNRIAYKARSIALAGLPEEIHFEFGCVDEIVKEFRAWSNPEILSIIFTPPPKLLGTYLQKKILMNAESFGFGPSAAIAELFPYMRKRTQTLSYIGSGHTLDLQSKLPYDTVYELNGGKEQFIAIAKDYDIFITASDFEKAQWAKELGLTLIIYDPLTWYWPTIPPVIHEADLYVAQNFFGVQERIANEPEHFPQTSIVPAILSGISEASHETNTLLVNLGGLNNPYISQSDIDSYAKIIFSSIHDHIAPEFEDTVYATNKTLAQKVQHICPAKTMLPHEVQKCLSASRLSFMTSGLGNLFEASLMQKKVVWLPPANDSQGQQILLLEMHGMIDARVDWSDIFEGEVINYFDDQQKVLQQIAHLMHRLDEEQAAQERFDHILKQKSLKCSTSGMSKLSKLAETFEVNGSKLASESIIQFLLR